MARLGSYERPAQRIGRLRNALMSTERSMGDTVTKAVDLEARRRTMEENLKRFRQVEQRLQPPAPRTRLGMPTVFPAPAPPSPVEAEAPRRAGTTAAPVAP